MCLTSIQVCIVGESEMPWTASQHSSNCRMSGGLFVSVTAIPAACLVSGSVYIQIYTFVFPAISIHSFIAKISTECLVCGWRYTKLTKVLDLVVFTFEWVEIDNK